MSCASGVMAPLLAKTPEEIPSTAARWRWKRVLIRIWIGANALAGIWYAVLDHLGDSFGIGIDMSNELASWTIFAGISALIAFIIYVVVILLSRRRQRGVVNGAEDENAEREQRR